jgi:erythromycin esterase-like protein
MADNLCWLATERYRDRKIVVWAATTHIMRNAELLEERLLGFRRRPYTSMIPMGHYVHAQLANACYSIGFIAERGRWQWVDRGGASRAVGGEIDCPPPDSFDGLFARAGFTTGFLDLRAHAAEWSARRIARTNGYASMTASWPHVLDGLFFTKVMQPAQRSLRF